MKYRTLFRWHIWLGWLVGVPLILWTASGLWMVSRPIEEVRGEHLRAESAVVPGGLALDTPVVNGAPVKRLALAMRLDRPVWLIERADGARIAADARTNEQLPPVPAALARQIADSALKKPDKVESVRRIAADMNPVDLRRERPAWQVRYVDGMRVYIDADTGEVLALRTRQWRAFDFMWGLHIMDLQSREDTHHPTLIGFAALSLGALLMAFWMLIARQRRKKRMPEQSGP